MRSAEDLLPIGNRMAVALCEIVQAAAEGSDDPDACMDLQDLTWEWFAAHNQILAALVGMAEKGYNVAIGEPHYCSPAMVYLLSRYSGPRDFAMSIYLDWRTYAGATDIYFFRDPAVNFAQEWLLWIHNNTWNTQAGQYTHEGELARILK